MGLQASLWPEAVLGTRGLVTSSILVTSILITSILATSLILVTSLKSRKMTMPTPILKGQSETHAGRSTVALSSPPSVSRQARLIPVGAGRLAWPLPALPEEVGEPIVLVPESLSVTVRKDLERKDPGNRCHGTTQP